MRASRSQRMSATRVLVEEKMLRPQSRIESGGYIRIIVMAARESERERERARNARRTRSRKYAMIWSVPCCKTAGGGDVIGLPSRFRTESLERVVEVTSMSECEHERDSVMMRVDTTSMDGITPANAYACVGACAYLHSRPISSGSSVIRFWYSRRRFSC